MAFFEEYFLNPILQNGWFNPVNTLAYSVALIIAVLLVFKLLFRMRISINRHFFWAVIPFIFWGSSTRVLHDAAFAGVLSSGMNEFFSSPIFPTPGSYIITFTLALGVLALSLGLQRAFKVPYWKPMLTLGVGLSLLNAYLLPWSSLVPLLLVGGFTLLWSLLFWGLSLLFRMRLFARRRTFLGRLFSPMNQLILGAHLLDASATFTALTLYGYVEQHVLPRALFPLFGPISMFILKIAVVLPVLWIIDSYSGESERDRNFKNFLKLVVLILGLAPGLRDLIRLMVGV